MLVNLSDVLTSEGKVTVLEMPLELTEYKSRRAGCFPIMEKSPVSLQLANAGEGKVRITGGMRLQFKASCDRCLGDVALPLELSFDRLIASAVAERGEDADEDEFEDTSSYMEGSQLDVENFVYNEISVNWPMKILCREDCKGICPSCGKNLNEGACGCDTFVPDPRMAGIQDIFRAAGGDMSDQ